MTGGVHTETRQPQSKTFETVGPPTRGGRAARRGTGGGRRAAAPRRGRWWGAWCGGRRLRFVALKLFSGADQRSATVTARIKRHIEDWAIQSNAILYNTICYVTCGCMHWTLFSWLLIAKLVGNPTFNQNFSLAVPSTANDALWMPANIFSRWFANCKMKSYR